MYETSFFAAYGGAAVTHREVVTFFCNDGHRFCGRFRSSLFEQLAANFGAEKMCVSLAAQS